MFFEEVKRSAASHDEKNIAGSPPVNRRALHDRRSGRFSTEVKRTEGSHEGEK
jgi:hypothetical protein